MILREISYFRFSHKLIDTSQFCRWAQNDRHFQQRPKCIEDNTAPWLVFINEINCVLSEVRSEAEQAATDLTHDNPTRSTVNFPNTRNTKSQRPDLTFCFPLIFPVSGEANLRLDYTRHGLSYVVNLVLNMDKSSSVFCDI
jgi:hypothetical protein